MSSSRQAGYWLVAAGASLFSTKAIFIKLAYQDQLNATLMLAYRMAFALPFFIAAGLWAWRQKTSRGEALPGWRMFAGAVMTGCVGYYLSSFTDFKGLEYISAQLERLLLFTYPIWVLVIGAVVLGQKITRHAAIAALVSYTGLAIVFGMDLPEGGMNTVIGGAWVIACAILFAAYQLLAKRFVTAMGSVLFTAIALTSSGVACILHHAIFNGDFTAGPRFLWLCAGCAVFATVLPSFLVNAGMARISPQAVAMISTISPLVTISLAVAVLGEPFTLVDAIGSALVLAGIGYFTWADGRAKEIPPPTDNEVTG
ncbi:MAG: DMT family transporter [Hyphomicrobiales bacterium]